MQDNLALQIIDEQFEEGFKISNDSSAEWALQKIAEETAEAQRYINVCDTMIMEYQKKRQKAQEQLANKTGYLKSKLQEYFATVPHKATKTQETYKLPSGTLKLKYGTSKFIWDEKVLGKFLKDKDMKNYYEEVVTPKWGELKKVVVVSGEKVLTTDGEIIEGVTAEKCPNVFEVEL